LDKEGDAITIFSVLDVKIKEYVIPKKLVIK